MGAFRIAIASALVDDDVTRIGIGSIGQWYAIAPPDAWMHRHEIGRFISRLHASGVLRQKGVPGVLFAFVHPEDGMLDLRAGLVANSYAALKLASAKSIAAEGRPHSTAVEALGIIVVHVPQMVPSISELPS